MQNTKKRSLIGDSGSFLPREKKKKSEYLCKALKSVTAYEVVQQYAVQGPELPLPFFFFSPEFSICPYNVKYRNYIWGYIW